MRFRSSTLLSAISLAAFSSAQNVASFDDLATPPPTNSSMDFFFANGDSLSYLGATWNGFSVVGDAYKVDPPSGPLFGLTHSGSYFATNAAGANGLTIGTTRRLLGGWFGRNEYYGFGAGASQIQITAYGASGDLGTVTYDLPENEPGQPEPLSWVDTSTIGNLPGVTGYRIDRTELGSDAGHYVMDDLTFAPVPEPATLAVLGLAALALRRKRPL